MNAHLVHDESNIVATMDPFPSAYATKRLRALSAIMDAISSNETADLSFLFGYFLDHSSLSHTHSPVVVFFTVVDILTHSRRIQLDRLCPKTNLLSFVCLIVAVNSDFNFRLDMNNFVPWIAETDAQRKQKMKTISVACKRSRCSFSNDKT